VRRWPDFRQFADAVLDPQMLGDAELRDLELVRDGSDRPKMRRGNRGTVFRFGTAPSRSLALKVFRGDVPDLRERQDLIGRHLASWSAQSDPLVRLRYLDSGVFVTGEWYPAVVMDWCEGLPLGDFLLSRGGRARGSRSLARGWVGVLAQLRSAGVLHGDLQEGNIIVDGAGAVRLVDYDGMLVPAMGERFPPLERGHEDYQHPLRTLGGYGALDAAVEDFSALVVLADILAGTPDRWARHDRRSGILLGRRDLADPDDSPVLAELAAAGGPVGEVTRLLRAALADLPGACAALEEAARLLAVPLPPRVGLRGDAAAAPAPARTGALPTSALPASALPTGALPTGALPTGALPTGALPTGALPTGALPTGALPAGALPTGAGPAGAVPADLADLIGERIAEGLSNAAIAEQLGLTGAKVRAAIYQLQRRLGVSARREIPAALRAARDGADGADGPAAARAERSAPATTQRGDVPAPVPAGQPAATDRGTDGPPPARTEQPAAAAGRNVDGQAAGLAGQPAATDLNPDPAAGPPAALTGREQEVLRELARLGQYQQVAAALAVSAGTVQAHARSIRRKLGAASDAEAVAAARRLGILPAAPQLTAKQAQTLVALRADARYDRAAAALGLSPRTVADHARNARRALDVGTDAQAVQRAEREGLLPDADAGGGPAARPGTARSRGAAEPGGAAPDRRRRRDGQPRPAQARPAQPRPAQPRPAEPPARNPPYLAPPAVTPVWEPEQPQPLRLPSPAAPTAPAPASPAAASYPAAAPGAARRRGPAAAVVICLLVVLAVIVVAILR
jgi:DNA-binding CsgD family transcriptional regulator